MSTTPVRLMLALGLAFLSAVYGQDPKPANPPAIDRSAEAIQKIFGRSDRRRENKGDAIHFDDEGAPSRNKGPEKRDVSGKAKRDAESKTGRF